MKHVTTEEAMENGKNCYGSKQNDEIPGGLADENKPEDFDQEQLEMGIKIEMEHTDDPEKAKEIAMDHLKETPDYYTRLAKMEKKAETKENDGDSAKGKKALQEIKRLKSKIETAIRIAEGTPSATYNIAQNLQESKQYLDKALSILR